MAKYMTAMDYDRERYARACGNGFESSERHCDRQSPPPAHHRDYAALLDCPEWRFVNSLLFQRNK